jgi:hypothetical protein
MRNAAYKHFFRERKPFLSPSITASAASANCEALKINPVRREAFRVEERVVDI